MLNKVNGNFKTEILIPEIAEIISARQVAILDSSQSLQLLNAHQVAKRISDLVQINYFSGSLYFENLSDHFALKFNSVLWTPEEFEQFEERMRKSLEIFLFERRQIFVQRVRLASELLYSNFNYQHTDLVLHLDYFWNRIADSLEENINFRTKISNENHKQKNFLEATKLETNESSSFSFEKKISVDLNLVFH